MKHAKSIFLSGIYFVAVTQMLHAEEQDNVHPALTAKFVVNLGVFFPDREVNIRVDGPVVGPSDIIDFQREFGLDRSDETFSLNFAWRFGKKWELSAQYFESSGARGAALDEDIEWNDVVFEQGSSVVAGQEFRLIRAFFGRNFDTSERYNFGVGVGVHWLELGAFIEGDVIIGGGGTAFRTESVSASAPLPNIGAWYTYSISPNWAIMGRLDWMSADVGDYDGRLINAMLGVNYQMFENFGASLSYNLFDFEVGISKSGWRGKVETKYQGPYASLTFYW